MGGDPEQEHFVDGVTESLTTDFSRIRGAVVIGRNTAFTYKGKAVDLKQIGRELNVRYVLEGSVQRGGNRMRVNVQLIDAETGNHLWAERFDKPLADLFDMQDEIVARLANTLDGQLRSAEARRAERAPNPDSMDLYAQGLAWLNKGFTPNSVAQARSFYDRALAADPDNVEALIGSAMADVAGSISFVTDPMAAFAAAEAKLTKVLSSVPDHARAHKFLGLVEIFTKRAAEGIAECEHALALDGNLAEAHPLSVMVRFISVAPKRPRLTSVRPYASVRAIRWHTSGWVSRVGRSSTSGVTSPPSHGFGGRLRQTEIIRLHIFSWPQPSRSLAALTRRVPPPRPVSRSTRLLPSPASTSPTRRGATIRRIWPSSSPFSRACARPGSRYNDRRPPPRRDPRRRPCRLHGRVRDGYLLLCAAVSKRVSLN
jgi:TolB-like protein